MSFMKRSRVAEYEIACCMAHELYPMDRKKREEYVKQKMRKTLPTYFPKVYYPIPYYPKRWKP